jgi:DNA-binding winged helix-turn-helix (wHTH) protein/Tfp pilus assembly protein PilF
MADPSRGYRFGPYCIDRRSRLLLRDGEVVPLTLKAFETLLALVERRDRVVGRDELMRTVWPDTAVEENNLSQAVAALRRALGDAAGGAAYIETFPRRGYRFAAEVEELPASQDRAGPGGRPSRWLARSAALAAVALAAVATHWTGRASRPRSVAVLPFRPMAGEARDELLESGLADALVTRLSRLDGVVVRPTSATLRFAGERDALGAGRLLRVDAVIDGHFQSARERLRVSVQLTRVASGETLWAERFDAPAQDLLALQDSLAARIARELAPRLTGEQHRRLAKRDTGEPRAFEAYLRGRHHWNKRTPEALRAALGSFQQAIDADPAFALAYAGLAAAHGVLGVYYAPPADAFPRARAAAERAIAIDPDLAAARAVLGAVRLLHDWDWPAAERELHLALALDPDDSEAHELMAWYLAARGRLAEAEAEIRSAHALDPLSLPIGRDMGAIAYWEGRPEQAVSELRKVLELESRFLQARLWLGRAGRALGRHEEALAELRLALDASPGDPLVLAELAQGLAAAGRTHEARRVLADLQAQGEQTYVSSLSVAAVHAALGDSDAAFRSLERALDERAPGLVFLGVEPGWAPLRGDPRFAAVLRRLGLELGPRDGGRLESLQPRE